MRLRGKLLSALLIPIILVGLIGLAGMQWSYANFNRVITEDNQKIQFALEMEINSKEAMQALIEYVAHKNKISLDLYRNDMKDLYGYLSRYKSLRLTENEKLYAKEMALQVDAFKKASRQLIDIEHAQVDKINEINALINNKLDRDLDVKWADVLKSEDKGDLIKSEIILEIEIHAHELLSATQSYVLHASQAFKNRINESKDGLSEWIDKLGLQSLNQEQSLSMKNMKVYAGRGVEASASIINLEDRKLKLIEELGVISERVDAILDDEIQLTALAALNNAKDSIVNLNYAISALIIIIIMASILLAWYLMTRLVLNPIKKLTEVADSVSMGEIDKKVKVYSKDELGALADSFRSLIDNTQKLAKASKSLGKGDFETEISPRSERDVLGQSLLDMKNNLQNLDSENKKKVWAKTQIGNVTQSIQGIRELKKLMQTVTTELAAVLNVGHGAFYSVEKNDNLDADVYLILQATYAYVERKGLSNRFKVGEGIIGQCALECEPIVMSETPDDYIKIASGLGEKAPNCIVALPVMFEGRVLGVFEFASFQLLNEEQMEVLNSVAGSLGIIINNVESHAKTEDLLKESQQMSEELQAQQEELRSANEELESKAKIMKESEEELKAQSEELQASNEELEEKSERLEQQNIDIERQNKEIQVARDEVEERAKDLAMASKYKSEFLANMSHELRTPLNSLLILSKNLSENKKGNLDEKQIKSATVIHKGGQDLLRLINDILDLSKVEAGKLHVEVDHVSLQSFAESMKVQFDPVVSEKGVEFIVEVSSDLPDTIDTDEQRLSQIIKNLLSNAIKFTEKGNVTLAMTIAGKSNQLIKFDVRDTGIGIPESKQREIFEAFQQADGSTSRQYGGTGLGLAISRAMADLLGGQVALASEPGKGSSFSLTIPLQLSAEHGSLIEKGAKVPIEPVESAASQSSQSVQDELEPDVYIADDRESVDDAAKSMLIIEDDPEFAEILMERSKEKGYLCIAARTGWSGVALAKKYKPKAIILDLGLPDLDGMKVLDQLKYDLGTRHIPVHVVSGRQATLEAKQKGAIGFLEKPIDEKSLNNTFSEIEGYIDSKIKKVLVVEDSEDSQLAIKTLISADHIEFDSVYSSADAMANIANNKYDCVILDLTLPDFSGFEMLKRLGYENVDIPPIIIYTGRELSEEEHAELQRYTSSIVLKGAESPERLLDEVSLFLHSVETELPHEHKKKLSMLHKADEVLLGKKILLVDDDMRNVFALSSVLEEYGLDVIIAANGKASLAKLKEHDDVSLVLMDIMMPVMDGYEAMKEIRKQKKYESLPIIALTAKAMTGDREKCLEAGATDYITKPVDSDQLLSMMKVWLFKS